MPRVAGRAEPPPAPDRRRPWWRRVLAGLIVLAVAAAAYVLGRETAPVPPAPVMPAVREVTVTGVAIPAGGRISATDLRAVTVQTSGRHASLVPAGALSLAQADGVAGLVAKTSLPAGTFLQRSLLSPSGGVPGPAQALVGLALKAGQLPAEGLTVGEPVSIVVVPTSTQGPPPPPVSYATATTWAVAGPDSSGTTSASVVVPAELATTLAGDAARGEVALVAVPAGTSSPRAAPHKTASPPRARPAHHVSKVTRRAKAATR